MVCRRTDSAKFAAANPGYFKAWRVSHPGYSKDWVASHPGYYKDWRAANPKEKVDRIKKQRRERGPDEIRAASAKWRAKNLEKAKATSRKWKADNPERARALHARWQLAHPENRRIRRQNRRALERKAGGRLSQGLAEKLFKLQRGKCVCCGLPLGNDYHLDHRMPLVLGGANEDWNMQLLRSLCNMLKHTKHPVEFMQSKGFLI